MQLFVDETPHTFSADPTTSVAQLLASMRSQMLTEGRLVTQAIWRGELVAPEAEEQLQATTVIDPGLLELRTCAADRVAGDLLGQVAQIFTPLQLQQSQIAELLNAGQTSDAMRDLAIYVEAWQNAQSALVACGRLMGWRYDQLQFADIPIEQHFGQLAEQLRSVRDALENQDLVLLGDILTYELGDTLQTWQQMLTFLAHQAESAADAKPAAAAPPTEQTTNS